ncbi:hypothetical protein [Bartonella ancashensis]|uniref:Phage protein n=1 Tax=Bartonella ancashensis TaxID=1318743 RepID=A0A0M3T2L8_9HYPH|nr:hypothetical protein [Bartonella ancashensis]ALE03071.1 Phage protein [Bartonella ancashensis]
MDEEVLTLEEQTQLAQSSFHNDEESEGGESPFGENSYQEEQGVYGVQASEAPPDPQENFMAYIQWLAKELKIQQDKLMENPHEASVLAEKKTAQTCNGEKDTAAHQEAEKLHALFHNSVEGIKQKHRDFDQAADFIYDMRAAQLAAYASIYPEMTDPKAVDAVIGNELEHIIRACVQKNQNPAEVIYEMAQKIGYTDQQSHTLNMLQERHNSARTLAAHNGASPGESLSLEMLDKMSEAEFNVWIDDPKNKAAFNGLMGGGER